MTSKKGNLAILGAGSHSSVVKDIALLNGYENICFFDDYKQKDNKLLFGNIKDLIRDSKNYKFFFVAIGNNIDRKEKIKILQNNNLNIINLIHPSSVVCNNVKLDIGIAVMANVSINANVKINNGCIINTSAIIDHDCLISEYSHICPGVNLAGNVKIGKLSWIGIGSTIIENIEIQDEVFVGAGSVVINNIKAKSKVKGIPAK